MYADVRADKVSTILTSSVKSIISLSPLFLYKTHKYSSMNGLQDVFSSKIMSNVCLVYKFIVSYL